MSQLTEPHTSLSQEIVCLVVCHVVRGTPKKPKWLEELRRDRVEGSKDGKLVLPCVHIGHLRPW